MLRALFILVINIQYTYTFVKHMNTNSYIFFSGGFPANELVFNKTSGQYTNNFDGCITNISLGNNSSYTFNDLSILDGENIGVCDN